MIKIGDDVAFAEVPKARRTTDEPVKMLQGKLVEINDDGLYVIENGDYHGYVGRYWRHSWELSKVNG
jgi:hypothetical protein